MKATGNDTQNINNKKKRKYHGIIKNIFINFPPKKSAKGLVFSVCVSVCVCVYIFLTNQSIIY